MKIIHTSDWHLGHTLYGYDRTEEQGSALDQIEDIVRQETPDALIVSGDIYDTPQPSNAVQTAFTEAVMRMHATSPETVIIITAGNHDSGTKHQISRSLWETQNVHMIGTLNKDNPETHIVEIPGKGYVIAVPYASERFIPEGLWQGLLDKVEERNGPDASALPVVLSAHLTVAGSDFLGHDSLRDTTVGGIDSIEISSLGTGYDYVALGHIHRPQTLEGSDGKVRYSGTPVPVSFDEAYPHSVSVVEIASHGSAPVIREIPIENPFPLVTLPSYGFGTWKDVLKLASDYPKDKPSYIRLNVEVDDALPPDAQAQARTMFATGQARFCIINARRKVAAEAEKKSLTVSEFRAMSPLDVVRLYAAESGSTLGDDLEALFAEAEADVKEDERNA